MYKDNQKKDIDEFRQRLGRHVVVIFRKGGRIKEERRYDSESDSYEEVMGVRIAIAGLLPVGIDMIGQGWIGFFPWEIGLTKKEKLTKEEKFNANCPVRVADVIENEQTGITTIYLESV